MNTELRCSACVDAVVKDHKLLYGSNGWIIGADALGHWVRDGAAVCGQVVLDWVRS